MGDVIKLRETNERLSGIGNVELDLQEQKEVAHNRRWGGVVCVCVSHTWDKQNKIAKDLRNNMRWTKL